MSDRKKQSVPEATRDKGIKMLREVYETRVALREYTAEKLSAKHGITIHSFKRIRQGFSPNKNIPAKTVQAIRLDLMRFDELREKCYSHDEIAHRIGATRYIVQGWSKKEGFTDDDRKPVAKHKRPEGYRWTDTPVGLFATMALTNKPSEARYY